MQELLSYIAKVLISLILINFTYRFEMLSSEFVLYNYLSFKKLWKLKHYSRLSRTSKSPRYVSLTTTQRQKFWLLGHQKKNPFSSMYFINHEANPQLWVWFHLFKEVLSLQKPKANSEKVQRDLSSKEGSFREGRNEEKEGGKEGLLRRGDPWGETDQMQK